MNKSFIILVLLLGTLTTVGQNEETRIDNKKLEDLIAFCDTVTMATEVMVIHKDVVIARLQDGA